MNDVLKFGKKLFTFSVVAVTIAWSMGLATLVPTMVQAAECPVLEAGDLYKVPESSSVYYLNAEMESMYFPTEEVFFSWGFSFSDVKVIPNTCFDNYEQATPAGLNFRPGSRLVKRVESPTVYAVLPGNVRAAIGSEEVAKALYGDNWAKLVRDLPGVFMSNFLSTAAGIDSSVPHNGQFIKEAGSDSVYYVSEGELYEVDGDVTSDVREVSSSVFAELAKNSATVTLASIMEDPAQLGEVPETPVAVVGGDLKIALSANTPEAAVVPINVDNVEFTKVIFTALDEAVTVNSIKIGRRGFGNTADFSSVTLYDQNGVKLGNTKTSWTSDGYMNYNLSGGWVIPANSSRTITITAKLAVAGKYNALGVEDVTTNGDAVTGLGVYGNQMNGVSVTVGDVTITDQLTGATKKIGETDVQLAKFKLNVGSTEDAELKRITLKNIESARDTDIANMYLMVGSKVLATDADMVKDEVTFVLDEPYFIKKSGNETFTVYGDIVNGVGNKVEFTLKNTTDLVMTGKSYNTALTVTNSYATAAEITIGGAELNISFTSVASDTLDDKTDVEFGTLTLSSGATDVEISEMTMIINKTSGAKSILDLELVDTKTGAAYAGVTTTENATTQTWKFEDELYLEAGKTYTFTVRGDIQDGVTNNHAYHLSMTVIDTNTLKATTEPEGDTITGFSIGSFTGKKVTVKAPELKVSSANLASIDVVEGQPDVILFETRMEAIADNVLVERMQFRGASNNAANFQEDNWSELKLVSIIDGKETQAQFLSNSALADNSIDFDRLNFTIAKGKVATIKVIGNVSATKDKTHVTTKIELFGVTAKDTRNNAAAANTVAGTEIATGNVISTLRTVSIKGTGILYVSMRNVDAGFNKDRVVLAGTEANVGKLRLRADYEDVRITKLVLTNANATSDRSADEVCLYDGTEMVACSTLIGATVTFSNLDKVIEKGTKDWTIKVKTLNIGKNYTGTSQDYFSFYVNKDGIEARGVDSGDELEYGNGGVAEGKILFDLGLNGTFGEAGDTKTDDTKTFHLAASRISSVASVNAYSGETVATGINGEGTYTAMIFSVTTEANSNTDANGNAVKTVLDTVLLDVEKNASTTFSGATIKRIGGATAAKALTVSDSGATATFTTSISSVLGEDAKIDAGTTAYYVVKVTIDGLSTTPNVTNWFQINMDDLLGASAGTNNIDWKDGNSSTKFDYLFLDAESVSGNRINAPQNN